MLFITGFFGGMGCKYESFLYLFYLLVKFFIQVKSSGQSMRFIQMIQFRIETKHIHQFSAANTQQNELRYFGSHISII